MPMPNVKPKPIQPIQPITSKLSFAEAISILSTNPHSIAAYETILDHTYPIGNWKIIDNFSHARYTLITQPSKRAQTAFNTALAYLADTFDEAIRLRR